MLSQLLSLLITAAALGGAVGSDANMTGSKSLEKGLKVRREGEGDTVTILHVSDTHSLHRSVGDLPAADLFIHSGDVSTVGSDEEVRDFNDWLGSLKGKYREMLVISGNHDYWETNWRLDRGALSESTAQSPRYFQAKITNAKVRSCWDGVFLGVTTSQVSWTKEKMEVRSHDFGDPMVEGFCHSVLVSGFSILHIRQFLRPNTFLVERAIECKTFHHSSVGWTIVGLLRFNL